MMKIPATTNYQIGFDQNNKDQLERFAIYFEHNGKQKTLCTLQNRNLGTRFPKDMFYEGVSPDFTFTFEDRKNAEDFLEEYKKQYQSLFDLPLGQKLSDKDRKDIWEQVSIMPMNLALN